jgi:hypothetical protein
MTFGIMVDHKHNYTCIYFALNIVDMLTKNNMPTIINFEVAVYRFNALQFVTLLVEIMKARGSAVS